MNKFLGFFKNFNKRSLKYGSASIVLTAVVIGMVLFINMIVGTIQDKGIVKTKFDLTLNHLYSIGGTTKDVLKKVDSDVVIYGLFDMGTVNQSQILTQIKDVLDQYAQYKHVSVKFLDPDRNPGLLKEIDASGLQNINKQDFVVKGVKTNKIRRLTSNEILQTETDPNTGEQSGQSFIGEQAFTGAIKYVTSEKTPEVYFIQGHQEGSPDTDFKNLKTQLERNNYDVKTLNLMTSNKIPQDAEILIFASPQSDISAAEKDTVKNFIRDGGKAVFLFDALEKNPKLPQMEDLLKTYNVGIDYDIVKETDANSNGSPYSVVLNVPKSSVMESGTHLLLANSRSIKILNDKKDYVTVTSLAQTSNSAVGERIDKADGDDIKGPLDLAAAVDFQGGKQPTKILVMGNAYFVSDAAEQAYGPYYQYGSNFFTTALNWMTEKKDDLVIDPKSYSGPILEMSSQQQINTVAVLTVIVFPLLILGFGTFIWLRRRHL